MRKTMAAVAAMAMAVVMAVPAVAAVRGDYEVNMYGYMKDSNAYMLSSHTDAMIKDVDMDDDGRYVVTFQETSVYGHKGHIAFMSLADGSGRVEAVDDGNWTLQFAFEDEGTALDLIDSAGNITEDGAFGTPIKYGVAMGDGTAHSTSEGAISVQPIE